MRLQTSFSKLKSMKRCFAVSGLLGGGSHWVAWWRFAPGLLLTSGVGVVFVVFHPCAEVSTLKLCLSLLHSLMTMAYSRLRECCSTLTLPLPLVSVHNNSTLVPSPRIGWFIKPFTHQIICQRRQPWGRLVGVCSRSPTNIWCQFCDCGF